MKRIQHENIVELLEEEMRKCYALNIFKGRVNKHGLILPEPIIEHILSFHRCSCRRCERTRKAILNEPPRVSCLKILDDIDDADEYCRNLLMNRRTIRYRMLWYFTALSGFPTFKTLEDNITSMYLSFK